MFICSLQGEEEDLLRLEEDEESPDIDFELDEAYLDMLEEEGPSSQKPMQKDV